ncbi:hypothetical protein PFISCL1PPCAC_21514, partial [Pristionchus fissidentatus]
GANSLQIRGLCGGEASRHKVGSPFDAVQDQFAEFRIEKGVQHRVRDATEHSDEVCGDVDDVGVILAEEVEHRIARFVIVELDHNGDDVVGQCSGAEDDHHR